MNRLSKVINLFEEMAATPHFKLKVGAELNPLSEGFISEESSMIRKLFGNNKYFPDTGKVTVV